MKAGHVEIGAPINGLEPNHATTELQIPMHLMQPKHKIQVFISSICGNDKYDNVRSQLKQLIEGTQLATVYLFEGEGASSLQAGSHYLYALEDSDVCIFLIDNADGITQGVQKEIDLVKKNNIKALYYFCDENQKEKTTLELSLQGAQFAKSKTVHQFNELIQNGAQDLLNDITSVYHHYCKKRLYLRDSTETENMQRVEVVGIETIQPPMMPKAVLKNIDKSVDYYLNYVLGYSPMHIPGSKEKSSDLDEWCLQFLPVLYEGKTIRQFNVELFLESLKKTQTEEYTIIVSTRWKAIQAYFMGNAESCVTYLEEALRLANESRQPLWVINDILIDLQNQQSVLAVINNRISIPQAQQALSDSEEEIYYPVIDRIHESLYQKIAESAYSRKLESPYSITIGSNYNQYGNWLASSLIIAMYNGSLTHILLNYDKVRAFDFHLSCKYEDWSLRKNLLQLAVFNANSNEIKGLQRIYPTLLAHMTSDDAIAIMEFCNNHPLEYRRFASQLLGFGAVAYYLSDDAFKKYEAIITKGIINFVNEKVAILAVGVNIFKCLDGAAYRMKQESLVDICCLFMEQNFTRWYDDMFSFIANRINLRRMNQNSAQKLVSNIITLMKDDQSREQIKHAPRFLYVLRKQDRELTAELDSLISEYLPDFYSETYKLETIDPKCHDMENFVLQYAEQIKQNNERQGKGGMYFEYASRNAAIIRSIFVYREDEWNSQVMDIVINVASETLLHSQEHIRTKLDTISLLICIAIKFPEAYKRNIDIYNKLYEQQESIIAADSSIIESNIDSVALQICLNLLYAATGVDVYTTVLELFPLVQNDAATSISIAKILDEYLELSNTVVLPQRVETVVLQNVLGWLHSEQLDLRCIATRILLALARNPENRSIVDRKLVSLIDEDCVYIKNLILRRIGMSEGVSDSVKKYIMKKCESDANYVVRMVCQEEMQSQSQSA